MSTNERASVLILISRAGRAARMSEFECNINHGVALPKCTHAFASILLVLPRPHALNVLARNIRSRVEIKRALSSLAAIRIQCRK